MIIRQAEQLMISLKNQWTIAQQYKTNNTGLYVQSANMIYQEVMTEQINLALEGINKPIYEVLATDLKQTLSNAAKREADRQSKALLAYQRWALKKINMFNDAFAKTKANWHIYKIGFNNSDYKTVRDEMIKYLLPINIDLLDMPVQKIYQQAFKDGWQELDGEPEQTEVAEKSVLMIKKPMRDFLEGKP